LLLVATFVKYVICPGITVYQDRISLMYTTILNRNAAFYCLAPLHHAYEVIHV